MDQNQSENSGLAVEQRSLECEKIKLERDKLAVERYKARLTALSIGVPVLVAIITLGWASHSENQRALASQELQRHKNEDDLRLKALEVLLNNPGPETANKAKILMDVFPAFQIRQDVIEKLTAWADAQALTRDKLDMFHTYANSSREKEQLVRTYNQLFQTERQAVTMNMVDQDGSVGGKNGTQLARK